MLGQNRLLLKWTWELTDDVGNFIKQCQAICNNDYIRANHFIGNNAFAVTDTVYNWQGTATMNQQFIGIWRPVFRVEFPYQLTVKLELETRTAGKIAYK